MNTSTVVGEMNAIMGCYGKEFSTDSREWQIIHLEAFGDYMNKGVVDCFTEFLIYSTWSFCLTMLRAELLHCGSKGSFCTLL